MLFVCWNFDLRDRIASLLNPLFLHAPFPTPKAWQCAGVSSTAKGDIDPRTADFDHCLEVVRRWHQMRLDLERRVLNITGNLTVLEGQVGNYTADVFMGHCSTNGPEGYLPISVTKEVLLQIADVIWNDGKA